MEGEMRSYLSGLAFATALFAAPVSAQQQAAPAAPPAPPPGYGAPISLDDAKKAAAGAEAEMKKNNWNLVIAVVGPSGDLVYLQKADLAAVASVTVAHEKAKTSATFRAPSKVFMDRLANGETYLLRLPGVTPVAGGLPIIMGGKVVGAIGVSGASSLQDHQAAQAGIDALK
jgi:glc operon protein GlcG